MGPLVEILRSQPVHLTSCQNAFCDGAWGRRIVSLTMHHSPCTQCFQPLAWWAYIINVSICYHSNYIVFVITLLPLFLLLFDNERWNSSEKQPLFYFCVFFSTQMGKIKEAREWGFIITQLWRRGNHTFVVTCCLKIYIKACVYNGIYSQWHHTITSLIATSSDNCGTGQVLHSN